MSQPSTWGVPRTDGGNEYTPEQFAERTDESFDALLSLHKGASRPSYATAGTMWLDDNSTPWTLKLFDGSDDIAIGTVNPSDNKFTPSRAVLYEAQTLDPSEQAQARANIGIVFQSSAQDTTAGRVLRVGAFGIGGRLDMRDTIYEQGEPQDVYGHGNVSGFARGGTDGLQIPGLGANAYGGLTVSASYTDSSGINAFYRQFVHQGRMWIQRAASAAAWGAWQEFYHTGNLSMPTLEQLGGVPTSRTITAGTGLTGGGDLSADRTISLASGYIPLGVGQSWQNVRASRALNTVYQNTTGRSIAVMVKYDWNTQVLQVSHNGSSWVTVANGDGTATVTAIVPPGHYYRMTGNDYSQISNWVELR